LSTIFCMKQEMPTLSWHFVSLPLKDLTRRTPKNPRCEIWRIHKTPVVYNDDNDIVIVLSQ
jgi:hypothetical protein